MIDYEQRPKRAYPFRAHPGRGLAHWPAAAIAIPPSGGGGGSTIGAAPDYTAEFDRQRKAAEERDILQLLAMITPTL